MDSGYSKDINWKITLYYFPCIVEHYSNKIELHNCCIRFHRESFIVISSIIDIISFSFDNVC